MHLGCLGPILFASPLYFLHSTSSSVITVVGGGGLWWIEVLGALLHTRRPDIANGRYISGLLRFHFTLEIDHLPRWHSSKESECRWCRRQGFRPWVRRQGFRPWVRKIPWSRKWQPTPVFLPGEFKDREAWRVTVHGIAESGQSSQAASPGLKLLETEQSVGLWAARTLGFNCGWSWFAATLQGESLGSKHLSLLPSSLSPHLPSSPADTPHWPDSPGNLSLSRSASCLGTEHSGGWWRLVEPGTLQANKASSSAWLHGIACIYIFHTVTLGWAKVVVASCRMLVVACELLVAACGV